MGQMRRSSHPLGLSFFFSLALFCSFAISVTKSGFFCNLASFLWFDILFGMAEDFGYVVCCLWLICFRKSFRCENCGKEFSGKNARSVYSAHVREKVCCLCLCGANVVVEMHG